MSAGVPGLRRPAPDGLRIRLPRLRVDAARSDADEEMLAVRRDRPTSTGRGRVERLRLLRRHRPDRSPPTEALMRIVYLLDVARRRRRQLGDELLVWIRAQAPVPTPGRPALLPGQVTAEGLRALGIHALQRLKDEGYLAADTRPPAAEQLDLFGGHP